MRGSPHEHALLAYRWLQCGNDPLWADFPRYWIAFNALYNAVSEDGDKEATAVERVIRIFFNSERATACLDEIDHQCTSKLIAIPPGDDRLNPNDPRYREKTTRLVDRFKGSRDPVDRLASLMLIVYQVRCNLVHGSKDPVVMRDQDLVSNCTPILKVVVSQLENIMERHHSLSTPT